jgi:hypothetical protein
MVIGGVCRQESCEPVVIIIIFKINFVYRPGSANPNAVQFLLGSWGYYNSILGVVACYNFRPCSWGGVNSLGFDLFMECLNFFL